MSSLGDLSLDAGGSPDALRVDAMARRQSDQKALEEKFRFAVEANPGGIVISDAAGKIMFVNKGAERLFGYSHDEMLGQTIELLVPKDLRAQHVLQRDSFAKMPKIRRHGTGRDLVARRKDGTEFPVEIALNPIQSPDGPLVLSVISDISERKRLERLKDDFVATVSHELRTPLTSISASLALLTGAAQLNLPESARRLVQIAHCNSARLVRLINDILEIEKIESGKIRFKMRKLELRSLAEQTIETSRPLASDCGIALRLEDSSRYTVYADADRLTQVITNLLSNAIKFSPQGAEVSIALRRRGDHVHLSVRDHGPGIPPEFRPRLFEKFAQAGSSNAREKGGTGLGLSIVKQIVHRLGGEVGFEDAPGGGTVFYVALRCAKPLPQSNNKRRERSADNLSTGGNRDEHHSYPSCR